MVVVTPEYYKRHKWSEQSAPEASQASKEARELRLARQAGQRSSAYVVSNKGARKPQGPGPMSRALTKLAAAGVAVVVAGTVLSITTDVEAGTFAKELVTQKRESLAP